MSLQKRTQSPTHTWCTSSWLHFVAVLGFGSGAMIALYSLWVLRPRMRCRNQDHNWYLSMMLYGVELPMIVRHQMREMMKSLGGLDLARKWKSSLGTEMTAQLRNKNPTRRIIHPCGVVRCCWIYTKRSKDYCSKLMRHSSLSAMFLVLFFPFEVETFSSATEICTAGGRYIFF